MNFLLFLGCQGVIAGTVVVVVVAVVAKFLLLRKKTYPKFLKDPQVKYPVKLIDREVCYFCNQQS